MPDILVLSPGKKKQNERNGKKEKLEGKQIKPFKIFGTLQKQSQGKIERAWSERVGSTFHDLCTLPFRSLEQVSRV